MTPRLSVVVNLHVTVDGAASDADLLKAARKIRAAIRLITAAEGVTVSEETAVTRLQERSVMGEGYPEPHLYSIGYAMMQFCLAHSVVEAAIRLRTHQVFVGHDYRCSCMTAASPASVRAAEGA